MRIIVALLILMILNGCQAEKEASQATTSNLQVDHVNLWVADPTAGKQKLEALGFTAIPDSLSTVHQGQGTTGRYFYFLNAYLELIFINNQEEFVQNAQKNNQLDFMERANHLENGFAPFSVSLQMKDYDQTKIPFETIAYGQDWMGEEHRIYVAKNAKIKKEEPSIFVIYPSIAYDIFDTKADLSKIPEEYALWRSFYYHKNGAEKISKIKIHTHPWDDQSATIKALQQMELVELVAGENYLMELYFDNQRQGKSYDLRPELPLKIHL